MTPLILGTRGSPLALAQTRLVAASLKQAWPGRNFEIYIIKTEGDRLSENPPLPGQSLEKGLFTAELERALFKKQIDIAVHSLKDLPTETPEGLVLASIPRRADARDVLITRGASSLDELPTGALVATGSPRRAAQLLFARSDLEIVDIRGNIDTRLRKFRETGAWSALILAAAGLERLHPNVRGLTLTPLPYEVMLPAPGQGALALQTNQANQEVIDLLRALHDPLTSAAVEAERMFLHALGGGCLEPIAAHASPQSNGSLRLDGIAWLFGETTPRRAYLKRKPDEATRLGIELAVEISR
jgi:hydroxymethylbilane synthase